MALGKPVRTTAFVRLAEPAKTYKSSTTAEIRADNARMRKKANRSLDKLFDSPYTSEALERRKRAVSKELGFTPTDRSAYRFKGNRNATREELIEENRRLSRFLNSKTRTVGGIISTIDSLRIHPTIGKILKGAGDVEASELIGDLFAMADEIVEQLTAEGRTLNTINTKYEALDALMADISLEADDIDMVDMSPELRRTYMTQFVEKNRARIQERKDAFRARKRAIGAWMDD